MIKKLSFEIVKERFIEKGYTVTDTVYLHNHQKLNCVDNDGYKYVIKVNNLAKMGKHYPFVKFNPYVLDNIQRYLDIKSNGTKLLTTEYFGNKQPLKLKCICGKTYCADFGEILCRSSVICGDCKRQRSKEMFSEDVYGFFGGKGLKILDSEKYIRNNIPVACKNNDGYFVKISLSNLQCGRKPLVFSLKFNRENYIRNLNIYFDNNKIQCEALRINEKSTAWSNILICKCSCGNEFTTNLDSIKQGQVRCRRCAKAMSRSEEKVAVWLKENNVEYVFQKRFEDCIDIRALPFDFYIPSQNMCIEVDGQQHEVPFFFNDKHKENCTIKLYKIKFHDNIKNEYCKFKNIKLLRLPYSLCRGQKYKEELSKNIVKG